MRRVACCVEWPCLGVGIVPGCGSPAVTVNLVHSGTLYPIQSLLSFMDKYFAEVVYRQQAAFFFNNVVDFVCDRSMSATGWNVPM